MSLSISFFLLALFSIYLSVYCARKGFPHHNKGLLPPFAQTPITFEVSSSQAKELESGKSVIVNKRDGLSGSGFVLQDINAPPYLCMELIKDVRKYPKLVKNVKKVEVYDEKELPDGSHETYAEFKVGIPFFSLTYYLRLLHSKKHNTFTWTLDYNHESDLEDSVGLWQVMPHPNKKNWTRILYSTQLKLPNWVPEVVISTFTKSSLKDSTAWVKKEAENLAKNLPKEDL